MKHLTRFPGLGSSKLAYKFSLAILLIIMALGTSIYLAIDSLITKSLHDQHRQRGVAIASNLAYTISDFFLINSISQMQVLLTNTQASDQEIVYIFIIDSMEKVPAHTFPGGFPGDLKRLHEPHDTHAPQSRWIDTEKGVLLDISVPIQPGSLGYVHLGLSGAAVDRKIANIQQRILLICILACMAAIALAIFLSRFITKPLSALAQGAESIGQGDLSHRVPLLSRDELGVVATAFNQMAASLEEDIAKRMQIEKALQESEKLYRSLVENINMGITLVDQDHTIIMANTAQSEMFQKTAREFTGKKCFQEFEKKEHICPHCPGQAAMQDGQPKETTARGQRDDGSTFTVRIKAFPVPDRHGNYTKFIEVVEDITKELRVQEELIKIKKLESIGVLAGGIAHDFNNILAAIVGNISLALFDQELKERTRRLLTEVEKASLRAKDLTVQLLTFAKGGAPLKEVTSLEQIITDSANFVLSGDTVACHYSIPGDLWLADIDKGQISQVIQNIVLNASQAMPDGGTITINCENTTSTPATAAPISGDGRFVKISIIDSGTGIADDILDTIFDPYFSTHQGSSGLGLAICQSIIKRHHGHISVESSQGVGSTFTIYLPAAEKKSLPEAAPVPPSTSCRPLKVLVMDDEEIVRSVSLEMLKELGHRAELSEHGEQALALYQEAMGTETPFDLVIMDLTVPGGMGGKEMIKRLLALDPGAKAVVASGYSNDPIMANFNAHGFRAAIAKPYDLDELTAAISKAIS